jgi:hypothetical protein
VGKREQVAGLGLHQEVAGLAVAQAVVHQAAEAAPRAVQGEAEAGGRSKRCLHRGVVPLPRVREVRGSAVSCAGQVELSALHLRGTV